MSKGHTGERYRCRLIAACGASAQAAMDAASIEVNRGTPEDSQVEVLPGTRGARTVSGEERDRMADNLIVEIRQRLDNLAGLFPCEGREPFPDLDELGESSGK